MITQQLKDAWLKELRDPSNKQIYCRSFPQHIDPTNVHAVLHCNAMCAYGAHVKAAYKLGIFTRSFLLPDLGAEHCIVAKNDVEKRSFAEIADYIEKNVQAEG